MDGRHPVTPSPMRRAIARRMVHSKSSAPHFYLTIEIEMDAAIAATDDRNAGRPRDERLSLTAVLVKALALTLAEHPRFNSVWDDDTLQLVDAVNVGVAITVDDGLMAPAILGCEALDLDQVGRALRDLVARTRTGHLRAIEIDGATFTLSNLGAFDVAGFTAIITPPQVAILATGRSEPRAVVRDGQIVIRHILTATLSADHRAVDGAAAAAFLGTLGDRMRAPFEWMEART